MPDLKTQLTEYLDHVVERVDVDEIFEERVGTSPVRPLRPRRPQRQWRNSKGWAVAAVVFVAVVLAGVLVGLLRSDSTVPVVDAPPSTVAPPATTVPPATAVEDAEGAPATTVAQTTEPDLGSGPVLEWEEIDSITSMSDAARVLFDGQGFLVIQCAEGTILLSSSQDGISWDETSYVVDPPFEDGCYEWAATPQIVLGASDDRAVRIDRATGEVTHIQHPASLDWARPIAAGNGFFMVDPNGSSRTMFSPDGLAWSEISIAAFDPNDPGLRDVASLGGEYLAMSSNDEGTTSSYRSQDGVNWTPTDCCTLEGWVWNVWGPGLLPWNGGVIAVIFEGETPAVLYHVTNDGVTALPHPPFSRPFEGWGGDVRAGELGIIVMPGSPRNEVFFSTDGLTWTVSPAPDQVGGWGEGAVGPDAIVMPKWNAGDLTLLRGTIEDGE